MANKMSMVKIAVLGEGGVGKTSITIQMSHQHFVEEYDPTLEDSYRRQCVVDDEACLLEILDTAGQEEFTALREQWIRDSELFLIVYSVTYRPSFEAVQKVFEQVLNTKEKYAAPGGFDASLIILVGNKSDLDHKRTVGISEGRMLSKKLGCAFIETSAKTRTNVEEAFYKVIRADRKRKRDLREQEDSRHKSDMADLGVVQPKARKSFFKRILSRN
ncbi:RAS1 protein [Diaporthe australafricana]|uniref:RAS1 protein n=1 Tax=Diaporthe australafricana TaxID=127596 RepID=A0ABR3XGM9_9PEZI